MASEVRRPAGLDELAALTALKYVDDVVAVVEFDPQRGFPLVWGNPAISASTGWTLDELVGRPMAALQPPEVIASFRRHGEMALRDGRPVRYQVEREVPTGRNTYQLTMVHLAELGRTPPYLLTVTQDLTALRRVTEALTESQEAAGIGSWSWDIASGVVQWSRQLYAIFGLDPREFRPTYESYLDRVHVEDRDRLEQLLQRSLERCEPFEIGHRIARPDGEVRRVRSRGRVVLGPDGIPVRMTGTAMDMTDRTP